MNDPVPPDPSLDAGETVSESPPTDGFGDRLRDEHVATRLVRGGGIRFAGYAVGTLAVAGSAVLLLRYLGPSEFGDFSAVMALAAIVIGIADSGLNSVGNRELALCKTPEDRRTVLSELLGIRLTLTPLLVLGSILFAIIAGYSGDLVLGVALAGIGVIFTTTSSSFALPLAVDLRIVSLTILDVLKQVAPAVIFVILIASGSGLLPFFAATIPGAVIAIALTPRLAGRASVTWPNFRIREWGPLALKALPVAIAATIAIIYLRVLTIVMYELTSSVQTGYFSTSVRAIELLLAIPWLVFSIALPVLSITNDEDRERTRAVLQRMIDVGIIAAIGVSISVCLAAPTIVELIAGPQYAPAIPILQIHAFILAAAFVAQACMFTAVAVEKTRELVWVNAFGLSVIVAFGIPLVQKWQGEGAAVATLIAEFATAAAYLYVIRRGPRGLPTSLRAAWKPVLAGAVGVAAAVASGASPVFKTVLAAVVYLALVIVLRAIPPEIYAALHIKRIA